MHLTGSSYEVFIKNLSSWMCGSSDRVLPSKYEALSSNCSTANKKTKNAWCQWLMLRIITAWEAEMGRVMVLDLPGQIDCETPYPKYPEQNG
jgi:hypothetical protein